MIAQELEVSLHMAFMDARQKRHELITVEHLLLAMIDNPTAAEVLRSCGANLDNLRSELSNTAAFPDHTWPLSKSWGYRDGTVTDGDAQWSLRHG